jgi:Homoserine dehydrogenase
MKKQLRIGILGLGVVGSGVVKVLKEHQEKINVQTGVAVSIVKAFARHTEERKQLAQQYQFELVSDLEALLLDDSIDVVVEVIGKISPAKEYIIAALERGKHVVTANKDLIAQHGVELVEIATNNHVSLFYEASVAGGIPILRTLTTNYLVDDIINLRGIVNGTTNYMLTKMLEEETTYEEALAQAQALGFAESDPSNDVDGIDAAYKMIILTQFAYGMNLTIDDVEIQGIRGLASDDVKQAQALGYEIKLIGESVKTEAGIHVSVGPTLVAKNHPLESIKYEYNGIFIESRGIGQSMFYGPGAGSLPTATSVVSDITAIARNTAAGIAAPQFNEWHQPLRLTPPEKEISKYYLAGVFAEEITVERLEQALAATEIPVNLVIESPAVQNRLVVMTEPINKLQLQAAQKQIEKLGTLMRTMKVMEENRT